MLSSAEIKRQILIQSDKSGFKERWLKQPPAPEGITEDEIIEMANALEALSKTKGWNYIESFMLREIDVVGVFYGESPDATKIGHGKAMIKLMHYVDQTIKARDEIIKRRANEEREKGKPKGTQERR